MEFKGSTVKRHFGDHRKTYEELVLYYQEMKRVATAFMAITDQNSWKKCYVRVQLLKEASLLPKKIPLKMEIFLQNKKSELFRTDDDRI